MANSMNVDGNNFDVEVAASDVPVLVDFWAPWCGPCKMIGPIVEELAAEYDGKVKVAKINVDDNRELATRFGIRGIPTVMIFKDGNVHTSYVGVKPKEELASALDSALN